MALAIGFLVLVAALAGASAAAGQSAPPLSPIGCVQDQAAVECGQSAEALATPVAGVRLAFRGASATGNAVTGFSAD
jgi:hypothetical protein